jgi:chromosome segregation ATPase
VKIPLKKLEKEYKEWNYRVNALTQRISEIETDIIRRETKIIGSTGAIEGLKKKVQYYETEKDKLKAEERAAKEDLMSLSSAKGYMQIRDKLVEYQQKKSKDESNMRNLAKEIIIENKNTQRYKRLDDNMKDRLDLAQEALFNVDYWREQYKMLADDNLSPVELLMGIKQAAENGMKRSEIEAEIEAGEAAGAKAFRAPKEKDFPYGSDSTYTPRDDTKSAAKLEALVNKAVNIGKNYLK